MRPCKEIGLSTESLTIMKVVSRMLCRPRKSSRAMRHWLSGIKTRFDRGRERPDRPRTGVRGHLECRSFTESGLGHSNRQFCRKTEPEFKGR